MTSPHAPLITALTTFYTLLADLHHYPPSAITLPPLPTGRYSGDRIDTDAARDNGFGPEAIDLLSQLPFLTDSDCQIAYDTQALNYLDDDAADAFDFARDPAYQERTDLMAEYVVVLTRGLMYGTELIYDTRNCRVKAWQHFSTTPLSEQPSFSMTSLDNPLYQWIISFLTLNTLPLDDTILIPRSPHELGYPGADASPEETAAWRKRVDEYNAERTIKDVFVESGWNPSLHVEQLQNNERPWEELERARLRAKEGFQGDEFERKKEEWRRRIGESD